MTGLREMIKRELARREEDGGKWRAPPRHDRMSPAAADVSTVG